MVAEKGCKDEEYIINRFAEYTLIVCVIALASGVAEVGRSS